MLRISQRNSDHLLLLINDLLDVQKMEADALELDQRDMDLQSLVLTSLDANRGYGQRYRVPLVAREIGHPVWVHGDWDRLHQVMYNLISNAVKFSPPDVPVEIQIKTCAGKAQVIVTDQGEGIPKDFQPRIFEKFSQADGSASRNKAGTGLGLSICKAIVEAHGGTIGFSTTEGKGTSFFFDLPLLPDQQ